MAIDISIVGKKLGTQAVVNSSGVLATGPLEFSVPVFKLLDVVDQAYNFSKPKVRHVTVITDIILFADKSVTTQATIIIYEADSIDEVYSSQRVVFEQEILKQTNVTLTGLNWKISEGKFLNAKTDDDDVYCNIASYHAEV